MNCADAEILLADYVDRTLESARTSELEAHLAGCAGCRQLAGDITGAVEFMERAAEVEAPPELVNRLLFEVTSGPSRAAIKPSLGRRLFGALLGGWAGKLLDPILQPRVAMGMAMTVLSLGMLLRVDSVRQFTSEGPAAMWTAAEDRVTRWWDRGIKYYQSLQIVFEIESLYQEWADQQDAASEPAAGGESQ